MEFLIPDKIRTEKVGKYTITINEKIIPDSLLSTKTIASWVKEGQPMKPCKLLNNGTGIPRGICIHNTADISTPPETNSAEQYCRSTYNGNMTGVVVNFYVYKNHIWQLLSENERGWHASDGQSRRASHIEGKTIGGNLDCISIECIGNSGETEYSASLLTAYLLKKYGLSPKSDIYTHNFFMGRDESVIIGASKNCPIYILPHLGLFKYNVNEYYNGMEEEIIEEVPNEVEDISNDETIKPVRPIFNFISFLRKLFGMK